MVGRRDELKRLKQAYESQYSEFVSIYGRRRIGKTFLVNEAFGYTFAFHVAGLKKEGCGWGEFWCLSAGGRLFAFLHDFRPGLHVA